MAKYSDKHWKLANEVKEHTEYLMARSRKDYTSYVELSNPYWIRSYHLEYICSTIQGFLEGDTHTSLGAARILVLNVPPQHGKSMAVTETLPSWYLGKNPRDRVIVLSYGDDLALRFGRRNKEKLQQWGEPLWGIKVSKHKKSDASFEIDKHIGSMISKGIMSGVTGNPADLILIDDPVKNREQADSDRYREKLWDEFLSSIFTRLSATGKLILIMTRWHEDDLAGRLIKSQLLPTFTLNLPCEAEENDPLGREPGDPLFPDLGKGKEWLKQTRTMYLEGKNQDSREMGSGVRAWNALFQGRPSAVEGNVFRREWWKYYDVLPNRFDTALISVDCSFKGEDSSDFVVLQAWGKSGLNFYLIDMVRQRLDFTQTLSALRYFSKKHKQCRTLLVEDKANGPAVINVLKSEIIGLVAINPEGSKESRASAITPAIESGHVFIPKFEPWTAELVDECAAFPNGKYDDMVDALSQALNRLYFARGRFTKTKIPPNSFYSPSERLAFDERHNSFSAGVGRPGRVKGDKKNAKRLNLLG